MLFHRRFLRIRRAFIITICLAVQLHSAWSAPAESAKPVESAHYASSMSVIPPVSISDQVEVEVRVSVRNHTTKPAMFQLVVNVELPDGTVRPVGGTPLEVAANEQELTTTRFASQGYVGTNQIRCRITGPDGFEMSHAWPLEVFACKSRALPLLQIGWLDPGAVPPAMTEQDLRDAIDHYHDIGITGLIITYPEYIQSGQGAYYPSRAFAEYPAPVKFDVVGTVLNQASKNGQHVIVGLGRGADLLLTWTGFDDPQRNRAALAHSMKTATELWFLYAHEPSFYGWYLTHEANDIAQASRAYYNPTVDFLRTFEADKPVLISPAGTPILSREILAASHVDIFAYQDAVGSGYVPYENTYDPQRRIEMLEDVYTGYAKAHRDSGKHLWANLEIWQMDGPEYGNSYPPTFERVRKQMEIERNHVDVITTYQLLGYMDPPDAAVTPGGPKATQLFEAYRNYRRETTECPPRGERSKP